MENTHMPILKVTKKAVVALAALLSVAGCVSHSSAPKIAGEKTRTILNAQIASSFAADETGDARSESLPGGGCHTTSRRGDHE
jgi:uncharacterized lipoprotein YajG